MPIRIIKDAMSAIDGALFPKLGIASSGFAGGVAVLENQNWLAIIAAITAIVTLLAGIIKIAESAVRIWVDLRRNKRDELEAKRRDVK